MIKELDPDFYATPQSEDFSSAEDPFLLFQRWMTDAEEREINDPNAVALATVDSNGHPNVRIVLLKGVDEKGFTFYTNMASEKGLELQAFPQAALCFHWKSLRRQVRIRGPIHAVTEAEADDYFMSRSRGSQIGAWASQQSRELESRAVLKRQVEELTEKYETASIPRPPHWSGFRLTPEEIEFWHDRPFRLHDRIVFRRLNVDACWTKVRLFP